MASLHTSSTTSKKKRMSSQKRKERSRDAARWRRSRESDLFNELSSCIPIDEKSQSQLDKTSIVRLVLSFVKIRQLPAIINPAQDINEDELRQALTGSDYADCLDGFVMVSSGHGDLVYVTDDVTTHLGLVAVDMIGHSLYDYTHPRDHEEMAETFSHNCVENPTMSVRMMNRLCPNRKNPNLKSNTWKVFHCTFKEITNRGGPTTSLTDRFYLLTATDIPHPSNIDIPLDSPTFVTRLTMDLKFSRVDSKVARLLGYEPRDLVGSSVFPFYHPADATLLRRSYAGLGLEKSQCEIGAYRFLAKTKGCVWLKTQCTIMFCSRTLQPTCIVCVNYPLTELTANDEVLSSDQALEISSPTTSSSPPLPHSSSTDVSVSDYEGDVSSGSVESPHYDNEECSPSPSSSNERYERSPEPLNLSKSSHHSYSDDLFSSSPFSDNLDNSLLSFPLFSDYLDDYTDSLRVIDPSPTIKLCVHPPQSPTSSSDMDFLKRLAPEAGNAMVPLTLPDPEGHLLYDELLLESAFTSPAIFVRNESFLRDLTPEEEEDSMDSNWGTL